MEGLLTKLRIPEGLPQVLEALARGVIRHQPEDIYAFAADICQQLWDEECRKENKSASAPLPGPSSPKLRSSAANEDAEPLLPTEQAPTSPEAELALPLETTRNEDFDLGEEDIASSPRPSPENTEDVTEKATSPISTIAKLKTLESPRSVLLVSRPASAASVGSQLRQSVASRPASVESKTLRSSSRPVSAEVGRTSAGGIRSLAASPTSPVPENALASSPTSDKTKLLDDGDAAVLIQAAYRGYRTRRSLAAKSDPLETNNPEAPKENVNENMDDVGLSSAEHVTAELTQEEAIAETVTLGSPRGQSDGEGADGLEGTVNDTQEEEAVHESVEEDVEVPAQENDTADLIKEEELTEAVTASSPREQVEAEDETTNDVSEPGLERVPTTDEEEEIWRKIQRDISLEDESQARAATKIQSSFRGYRVRRDLNAKTQTEDKNENETDVATVEVDDGECNIAVVEEENDVVNLEGANDAALAQENAADSQNESAAMTQEGPETEINENTDEAVQGNDAQRADVTNTNEAVVQAEEDADILEILQVGDKFAEETEAERLVSQTEEGVAVEAAAAENEGGLGALLSSQAADTDRPEINLDEQLNDETNITKTEDEVQPEATAEINDMADDNEHKIRAGESDTAVEPVDKDNETKAQNVIQTEETEAVNDVTEAHELGNEQESLIPEDNVEILSTDEQLEIEAVTLEENQQLGEEHSPEGELPEINESAAELVEAVEESVLLIETEPVVEESQVKESEEHEAEITSSEVEAENQQITAEVLEEALTAGPYETETPIKGSLNEAPVLEGLPDEDLSKAAEEPTELQDDDTVVTDQNDAEEPAETEPVEVAEDQEGAELAPVSDENPEGEDALIENEPGTVEIPVSTPIDLLVSEDTESNEELTVGDEVHTHEELDVEGVVTETEVIESPTGEEASVEVVTEGAEAVAEETATVNVEEGAVGADIEEQAGDQPTEERSVPAEDVTDSVVVEAAEQNEVPNETQCVSPSASEDLANVEVSDEPQSSLIEDDPAITVEKNEEALETAQGGASSSVQSPREQEVHESEPVVETTNEEVTVVEVHATELEENLDQAENLEENEAVSTEETLDSVVVEAAEQNADATAETEGLCLSVTEEVVTIEANDEQPSSLVEGVPANIAEEILDIVKDERVEGDALVSAAKDHEDSTAVVEAPTEANVEQVSGSETIEQKQDEDLEEPPPEYCPETMAPTAADVENSLEEATAQEQPAGEDVSAAQVSETEPEDYAIIEAEAQDTETVEGTCPIQTTEGSAEATVVEVETPRVEDEQEKVLVEETKDENDVDSIQASSPENADETPIEDEPKEDEAGVVEADSTNETEELSDPAATDVETTECFNIEAEDVQEESLITTSEVENLIEINQDLVLVEDSSLTTVQEISAEGAVEQKPELVPVEALNAVDEPPEAEKTPGTPQVTPESVASTIVLPTDDDRSPVAEDYPAGEDDSQDLLHRIVKLENGAEVLVIHHDEQNATELDNDAEPTAGDAVDDVGEEGPIVDEALASLTETITKVAMFLTSPVPVFPASDETTASPTNAEDNNDDKETSSVIEEQVGAESLECVPPEAIMNLPLTSLIEDERSMELVIESTEADNNAGIVEATWSPRPSPTEEIVVLENQHKIIDKIEEVQHVLGAFTCVIEDLSDNHPSSAANQLVTDLDDPEWIDCSDAHSSQHSRSSSPYNMQYLDPYYDGAATKIQANYRGYRTRQHLKRRKGMKTAQLNDTPTPEAESNNDFNVHFEETPSDGVAVDNEPSLPASEKEEILNSAATKIQARYRGYRTRRQLTKTKPEAATWTELQSLARGKAERDQAGWDPDKAATKIQAGVRGFLVRRRQGKAKVLFLEESHSVRNNVNMSASPKCVSLPRGFEYRRGSLPEFKRKHWHKLTTDDRRGSAPFLRLLTRTDSADGRRQAAAALKIQSAFRGYRVRKHRPLKSAPSAEVEVLDGNSPEDKAATKIQARYRGYRTRSGLKQVKASSVDQCDDQVVKAVQTIQAGFRGYKVRKDMGLIKPQSQKE